jgi:hypothetical protein
MGNDFAPLVALDLEASRAADTVRTVGCRHREEEIAWAFFPLPNRPKAGRKATAAQVETGNSAIAESRGR